MDFTEVSEADIPQSRGREGKVSTDLVTRFLESGVKTVKVDTGERKIESVRATIGSYIQRHELPVKVFTAGGGLYLQADDNAVSEHQAAKAKQAERKAAKASEAAQAEAPVGEVANSGVDAGVEVDDEDAASLYDQEA